MARTFVTSRDVAEGDVWVDARRRSWKVVEILESAMDFSNWSKPRMMTRFVALAVAA